MGVKYEISSVRESETKDLNVSEYFDTDEKVIITIRRLRAKQRNEITLLMLEGQKINVKSKDEISEEEIMGAEISMDMANTSWFAQVRTKQLIYSVVQNDNFPFNEWNEQVIDEIDERNPDLILYLQNEVQKFNQPLAGGKSKK